MTNLARVSDEQTGDVVVIAVDGEIDASNAALLRGRLRAPVTNRAHHVVLDLTGISYIDSAGINLLFELGTELTTRQQELRLVIVPGSPIERMAQISGVVRTISTHPTRDDALARAGAPAS